jgi:hypothetical protein
MSHAAAGTMPSAALIQLLAWIMDRPRTYAEAMEAWRTSCPRLSTWEDATLGGFVEVASTPGAGASGAIVQVTASGRALLASLQEA